VGRFDFGAAVEAVQALGDWQGPGQRVQAVIASLERGSLAGRGPVAIGAPSRRFRLGFKGCGCGRL
jgi:hypothetical protein